MSYPNKLSMSIMFENRKVTNEISIPKTSPAIWIPSKNINKCYKCKEDFSLWRRKHHCRVCGRIFCSSCADEWGIIPSLVNITSPPSKGFSLYSYVYEEKRMCHQCKNKTDFIRKSSNYIYIFTNLPITLKELYELRLVDKEWCKSINTILSFYKSVQYKLPTQVYSKLERQLLWNHRFEFCQHYQLMSKCLSSFNSGEKINDLEKLVTYYSKKIPKYRCNELACRRNCSSRPKIEEILEICQNEHIINSKLCRKWILSELQRIDINEIKLIIPWLINLCVKNIQVSNDILMPLSIKNEQLMYSFYFECKFLMEDKLLYFPLNRILNVFLKKIGKAKEYELDKTMDFVKFINENILLKLTPFKWNNQVREWVRKNGPVKLPWDTSIECIGVVGEGILCFNSATKPWKVPLIVKKNGKETRIDILVKFEDVRKDKLTMIMSKFIQSVCPDIVDIKTYNVFPIDDGCGWIEMVEQSNTLYDVKYKFNTTLQNYIMDLNPNLTVSKMRRKFIKTCVSSCVLCYVLGVGDRHLENILVTKDGQLLHIDFSYILGDDPKNLEIEMKITEDMLNMLGGKNSSSFIDFKKYCSLAYKNIRLRSSLWYILLSYLVFSVPSIDNYKHTYRTIENHVIERLLPGENDNEASMQIIDIVERSSTNNWKQNLADFSHKISNTFKDFTQFNMDI